MNVAVNRADPRKSNARVPIPLIVIVAATLASGLLGVTFAMKNDAEELWPGFTFGAIIGLFVSLFALDQWAGSRRYRLAQKVPIDRSRVERHAARWCGGPPWVLSRQQPGELVYWRNLGPSLLPAILLFAFGAIPGLIYVVATLRRTQTVALRIDPDPAGTDLEILVQPQGHDGRRAVNRFFNSLHEL